MSGAASTRAPADAVADAFEDGKKHLLLAASGSVATIKIQNIILRLQQHENLSIRVILTGAAAHFLRGQSAEQPSLETLRAMPSVDAVYLDEDEQAAQWKRGAGILHINLRKWAHLLVVAPLSANTLAKIANGLCDSLLTDVVRCWDTTGLVDGHRKRILVFPAMNAAMWLHPVTASQMRILEEDWGVKEDDNSSGGGGDNAEASATSQGWFEVFKPIQKELACGDVGVGGMREWPEIVQIIENRLGLTSQPGRVA